MSKKPAPLTSDLLVRKGDATPSSIDPQDRATAPDAPAPEASEEPTAPVMPEPDIVIAADEAEDDTNGSRRRLAGVLALVAVVTAGVLAVSMFGTDSTTSVAPLDEDTSTAAEAEAPSVAPIIAPPGPQSDGAPVPPEAAELRLDPAEASPDNAPAEEAPAPAPVETAVAAEPPAETPTPAAPAREAATITPPASEPAPAAAPEVAASAPASAVAQTGQYLIQLLSVRSEAAAKTAWANLQTAHGDLLGGETLNIEAADLGERGTFYRVRFGAFDGKADANAVCTALKAQGQDCLVKRAQ
ncbi:MAG: hypothetical protein HEP70_15035 [Rhodobiaceae bacterium]|nr:hypothetical protein [Rhodobiaceae bacterium]